MFSLREDILAEYTEWLDSKTYTLEHMNINTHTQGIDNDQLGLKTRSDALEKRIRRQSIRWESRGQEDM